MVAVAAGGPAGISVPKTVFVKAPEVIGVPLYGPWLAADWWLRVGGAAAIVGELL